jgi:hypothetical protein
MAYLFGREYVKVAAGRSSASWIPDATPEGLGAALADYFGGTVPALAAGLAIALALASLTRRSSTARAGALACCAIAASFLILPWLVSLLGRSVFVARYTIPALLPAMLLAGAAAAAAPRPVRLPVAGALVLVSAAPLWDYYRLADKEPWRQTAELLEERVRAGEIVVVSPHWTMRVLEYYLDLPPGASAATPRSAGAVDSLRRGAPPRHRGAPRAERGF